MATWRRGKAGCRRGTRRAVPAACSWRRKKVHDGRRSAGTDHHGDAQRRGDAAGMDRRARRWSRVDIVSLSDPHRAPPASPSQPARRTTLDPGGEPLGGGLSPHPRRGGTARMHPCRRRETGPAAAPTRPGPRRRRSSRAIADRERPVRRMSGGSSCSSRSVAPGRRRARRAAKVPSTCHDACCASTTRGSRGPGREQSPEALLVSGHAARGHGTAAPRGTPRLRQRLGQPGARTRRRSRSGPGGSRRAAPDHDRKDAGTASARP